MNSFFDNKKILIGILAFIFITTYIIFLDSYPLLDVDETRYVDMAVKMLKTGDFATLYLNSEYFFEKPPLFFWIECLSFKLLNISEFSARFPIVFLSLLPLGLLFSLCNKVKGFKFAFIASLVLMTSLEYAIITKIAILDSVLTSLCASSVLCYFYTFFAEDKNKKWFYLLTYLFMGLAVLAKGIPGFVIPFGTMIVSTIVFKTYKETFKSLIYGIPIFLLIALPWHIIMLKMHGGLFFQEYIYKHHILRFLGSNIINKNQPWYFYILTLIWGLIPHTLMLIRFRKNKNDKFLNLNIISALVILVFFSLSGAKLITYILPLYPFLAVIIAQIWFDYIENDDKIIKYILLTLNSILAFGAMIFPFVAGYFLRNELGNTCLMQVLLLISSYYLIRSIIKNERFNSFIFQSVFMAILIGFVTPIGYKIDYSFGQNDLIKYAKIAKEKHYTISTYRMGSKYSLLYYSKLSKIVFKKDEDIDWLKKELKKNNNFLIVKNKNIKELPVKIKIRGVKYSVVEGL